LPPLVRISPLFVLYYVSLLYFSLTPNITEYVTNHELDNSFSPVQEINEMLRSPNEVHGNVTVILQCSQLHVQSYSSSRQILGLIVRIIVNNLHSSGS
jgi:hypothetical protein